MKKQKRLQFSSGNFQFSISIHRTEEAAIRTRFHMTQPCSGIFPELEIRNYHPANLLAQSCLISKVITPAFGILGVAGFAFNFQRSRVSGLGKSDPLFCTHVVMANQVCMSLCACVSLLMWFLRNVSLRLDKRVWKKALARDLSCFLQNFAVKMPLLLSHHPASDLSKRSHFTACNSFEPCKA